MGVWLESGKSLIFNRKSLDGEPWGLAAFVDSRGC